VWVDSMEDWMKVVSDADFVKVIAGEFSFSLFLTGG